MEDKFGIVQLSGNGTRGSRNLVTSRLLPASFSLTFTLSILLLSYHLALTFTSLTPAQEEVFAFLDGKAPLSANFTALEASHLNDVRRVMNLTDLFFLISILGTILLLRYNQQNWRTLLRSGSYTLLISMGILALLTLLSFSFTFTLFHLVFFPQGNWAFPADSLLIQAFPLEFFVGVTVKMVLIALGVSMAGMLTSKLFANRS